MDLEFKSEEEKKEFCANIWKNCKLAYEKKQAIIFETHNLFRLIRVLEDIK